MKTGSRPPKKASPSHSESKPPLSHKGTSRHAHRPQNAADKHGKTASSADLATLADFTKWNEKAMEALRGGDSATSRQLLQAMLPVLQERLQNVEAAAASGTRRGGSVHKNQVQSWQLLYALTLNNCGCQLRRDGQTAEALQHFSLAQEVESSVFGKPSCSTMLNLSAVLLSMGQVQEALRIATECAAAAQDAEPILFITALHNLAVALGQQASERQRSAALPTMLQALRESQAALGEESATTKMLREKCGLSSQWIQPGPQPPLAMTAQESAVQSPHDKRTPSSPPQQRAHAAAQPSQQERARAALYTLNFDSPGAAQPARATQEAAVNTSLEAKPERGATSLFTEEAEVIEQPFSEPPVAQTPLRNLQAPLPPLNSNTGSRVGSATDRAEQEQLRRATPCSSNLAVSVDRFCLDSANISVMETGSPVTGFETVLQEAPHVSAMRLSRHGVTTLRDLCNLEKDGGVTYPSFLRFGAAPPLSAGADTAGKRSSLSPVSAVLQSLRSPVEPTAALKKSSLVAATTPSGSPVLLQARAAATVDAKRTSQSSRPSLAVFATAPVGGFERPEVPRHGLPPVAPDAGAAAAAPSHTAATSGGEASARRTMFGAAAQKWSGRAAQRQADRDEEDAYRLKVQAEQEAAEAAQAFEVALAALQQRTRQRAARTIQRAWRQWWTVVGKPRRHVQLQRLEEVQRRRRERLALTSAGSTATAGGGGKRGAAARQRTATVHALHAQQHGRVAGVVVPATAARCAATWLAKTACVRAVTRVTGSPVDARLHEKDVRRLVCRIQALWRGALQRTRLRAEHEGTRDAAASASAEAAKRELRDYAALVLQCAFRRLSARRKRWRLYEERYTPAAQTIQAWLRRTWASQRLRGVDGPTLRHRNAAALCVQRVWRGYQGRVAYRMAQLRQRIDQANPYVLSIEGDGGQPRRDSITPSYGSHQEQATAKPSTSGSEQRPPSVPATAPEAAPLPARTAAYLSQCGVRGVEAQSVRDAEREAFHLTLYVETMAGKERSAWQEAIRLRPTQVVRRRAELNAEAERRQVYFTLNRSARVIQRAFRTWKAMRGSDSRDTRLLEYARMRYQQEELGRAVERQQRGREAARAKALYGDSTQPMRAERQTAAAELTAAMTSRDASAAQLVATSGLVLPKMATSALQRREAEAAQRRDERLLALTAKHEAAHLREGPVECEARLGTTYEHPYYNPYVNDEHRRTLGID